MRTLIWSLACCLSVVTARAAMAQDRGLAIEYTVKVADIPGQLFHVTTDIRNINQPALECTKRSRRARRRHSPRHALTFIPFRELTRRGISRLRSVCARRRLLHRTRRFSS